MGVGGVVDTFKPHLVLYDVLAKAVILRARDRSSYHALPLLPSLR